MTFACVIAATLSFSLTTILVPVVIRASRRWGLFDPPGPLKIHSHPVSRLGGVAVAAAIAAAVLVAAPKTASGRWTFLAALGIVWLAGVVDDLRGLSIAVRLAAQCVAGIVLWRGGWFAPRAVPGGLAAIAAALLVVTFANSWNFWDGSDGLASGVTGIIAIAYAFLFLVRRDPLGAVVAFGVAAACAGFLPRNWPPARAFLGDSGATALGVCAAFLSLDWWRSHSATGAQMLAPLLISALPLLDAAVVITRRVVRGHSAFKGDRTHLYDAWLERDWSPRRVAFACCAITAAFAAIAIWGALRDSPLFRVTAVASLSLFVLWRLTVGSQRGRSAAPPDGAHAIVTEKEPVTAD